MCAIPFTKGVGICDIKKLVPYLHPPPPINSSPDSGAT